MKTRFSILLLCSVLTALAGGASAQVKTQTSAADTAAIRQTALDYIEGWYEGNAARMEHALHPELAKRMVFPDPATGKSRLSQMGAMTLVQSTRAGLGTHFTKEQQLKEVTILDVYQNAASVKIDAATWIDYLHMTKWNGEWKIVNVLWELKPEAAPKQPPK